MSELTTNEMLEHEDTLFFIDGEPFVLTENREHKEPDCYSKQGKELRDQHSSSIIESFAEHCKRIRHDALMLTDTEANAGANAIADFFASPGEEVMFEIPTLDILNAAIEAIVEMREHKS
jgi:hypothetical protein